MSDEAATTAEATPSVVTETTTETTESTFTPDPTLSEDDQIIQEIRHNAQQDKLKNVPDEEPSEPEAEVKDKEKDKKPAKGKEKKASTTKFETPDAAIEAVTKAFESGDIDALATLTGKPKSFFQLNDAKWAVFREREQATRKLASETQRQVQELNNARKLAREEFGTAIAAADAYREGNLEKFVELVSELAGEDYAIAQKKVIQGVLALDPEVKEMKKKLREQEKKLKEMDSKKEPEKAKEPTQEERKAAFERVVAEIHSELTGHSVTKIKNYERMVLDRVRDSFDQEENAYTLSFKEAADQIIEERKAESEALGLIPKAPKQNKTAPSPRLPPRSQAADARAPDGERWMNEDLDDDEIIAGIQRDFKAGRIK